MIAGQFLPGRVARSWKPDPKHGFRAAELYVGEGRNAIEIVAAHIQAEPTRKALLDIWKARREKRATPVLLVAIYPDGAALCGAIGEQPPIYQDLDVAQVKRLCRETIEQPDRHAALRFLSQALPSLEADLPGLNNVGLLALHELRHGVPAMSDWQTARSKAKSVLGKRGDDLLKALGFRIERIDNLTSLLIGGRCRTALAVMLREEESPEAGNHRFNSLSPVSYALKKADDENLPWVLLTQGSRIRLYATASDMGVGRRGRTETYIECQPSLLSDEQIPYLWLLYSADALAPEPDGSLHEILENSRRFAGDLAERLRERIYDFVVPLLAQGIAAQRIDKPKTAELAHTYEMALTVLFRLLFIAYAEDRDLLPYRSNDMYRRRSLKQKAQELVERIAKDAQVAEGNSHWQETVLLFKAIAGGNSEWGVPAYDGGLFSDDPDVSATGASLANLSLPNEIFETALRQLLVIETPDGDLGPVDFRSLGTREFGTIYEGLLESELALAETDLALDRRGNYKPAKGGDEVVARGEVYIHNRSGARKSSGSYYTKSFAVEHLLDGALEPALKDHFARLGRMDDTDAAEHFFDFRVADIAMGSGHFLIGAIDRIEKRMANWLADRPLPAVRRELDFLRDAACKELDDIAEASPEIEDGQLLRRMIARRCIYGVDLNGLSVQLARLSVWIHTFVPGLPLSFLDHNLVRGNALVGVGSIDDIKEKFEKANTPLFKVDADSMLGEAKRPLQRLANVKDATLADIDMARQAALEVRASVLKTECLCDIISRP